MRLPEYTERRYRVLRAVLIPARLAATAWALYVIARLFMVIDVDLNAGSMASDITLSAVRGVVIGIQMILCVVLAVFVWTPLPRPGDDW